MKKMDYTLGAVLLLIGLAISIIYKEYSMASTGSKAYIYVDNQCVKELDITENLNYEVISQYGVNVVSVLDSHVYVSESDCLGNDCVKMGGISHPGESICCLPHRLYIVIEGDGDCAVDTVAY